MKKDRVRPYIFYVLLALLSLGAVIGGCGQKGDLYLPDRDTRATR